MDTASVSVVRIVVADDHPIFLNGLCRLLESEPHLQVVGEAANADEAVNLTRAFRPDVLLLDLSMPGASGMEALRALSETPDSTRVIVLTAAIDKAEIVMALQLGARGIVLKESATALLMEAIRAVVGGQYWLGRETISDLVSTLRTAGAEPKGPKLSEDYGLTDRELQITALIVAATSNRDIGEKLGISEKTVKHHLTNIFHKLGVSSRLELALFAVNNNLRARTISDSP